MGGGEGSPAAEGGAERPPRGAAERPDSGIGKTGPAPEGSARPPAAAPAPPPSRGGSGYLQFASAERSSAVVELQAEGKPAGLGDVGKLLGGRWRALEDSEKAEWRVKAEEAARIKALAASAGEAAKPRAAPRARGMSSFMVFANERRCGLKAELQAAGLANVGAAAVGKALGERWRALGEEQKARYKAKAEELVAAAPAVEAPEGNEGDPAVKRPPLPLSLVKKLVCSDPDVKRISAEGLKAVTFATRLFLEVLASEALDAAQSSGRRTLRFEDLQRAAQNKSRNFFLADHLRYVRTTFIEVAGGGAGVCIKEALGNAAAVAARRPKAPEVGDGAGGGHDAGENAPEMPPGGEAAKLPVGRAGRTDKFLEAPAGTKQMTHFFSKALIGSPIDQDDGHERGLAEAENGVRKRVAPKAATGGLRKRLRIVESDEDKVARDLGEAVEASKGGGEAPRPAPVEAQ